MGVMLSDDGIASMLQDVIQHLKAGNMDQASTALALLEFERLTSPIPDPTNRRSFVDPAVSFDVNRVDETGDLISATAARIKRDLSGALTAAEAAAVRWGKKEK